MACKSVFEVLSSEDKAKAFLFNSVSRETYMRMEVYGALLQRWQKMINLVAPSTLNQIWLRHIADSNQVFNLYPAARRWVDFGSGGGFPGLITAIRLKETNMGSVLLIESDKRKCAFLREVIRETGARAEVQVGRVEDYSMELAGKFEIVTARALASLTQLLVYSEPLISGGALALFLKGKDTQVELTDVPNIDKYRHRLWPSQTDRHGSIVEIAHA